MYVNCISCGHKFDIGKSYDDYEGPVRCPTCRGVLTIRTEDGSIRSVRPGLIPQAAPAEAAPRRANEFTGSSPGVGAPFHTSPAYAASPAQPGASARPQSGAFQPLPMQDPDDAAGDGPSPRRQAA